ncbi:MAG: B12-binding domain-containing radical SAM protein, partial [bacterium]|nr:B12-binding domain-containing radical SAM protein [bacterium]
TLPFEKAFTTWYQADFLENYFLKKERLLHVLPHQMNLLTRDEILRKYNSYLPTDTPIGCLEDLLALVGGTGEDLDNTHCVPEERFAVPGLNRKIRGHSPAPRPGKDALRVLLLDLSQSYSQERQLLDELYEQPLGLVYLSTWLVGQFGSGVHCKIAKSGIDFDGDEELNLLLAEFGPGVIGIRTLTFYKDFFHRTAAKIRQWGYDIPMVAGGPYATNGYQALLQDRNIDLVVLGEGEITFGEIIGAIIENHGQLPREDTLEKIPGIAFVPGKQEGKTRLAWDILMLEQLEDRLNLEPVENPVLFNQPSDPVYTIYTSGS